MTDKYEIKLPVIKKALGNDGFIDIKKSSPKNIRDGLETIALYFKREERYDHIQYCADEYGNENPEYHGFAFTESAFDAMEENDAETPTRLLGGGCFRKRKVKEGEIWILDWVWIHPYARNKGLFTNRIDYFKEVFGDFLPEPPLSKPMEHLFFNKIRT
ncbi:hypothetical protein NQU47_01285 [Pseudoalteromonas distincta]|uniref:hypothetical protein n=1 Tax=Pseudoalteromonas distincta TaxID=77608 RepID=UPI00233F8FE1|nr:hypothetical protein [Pseudoalteromonas distincta]MDC3211185.1 hypothetical protein [Pseudoalteromonas distincta]